MSDLYAHETPEYLHQRAYELRQDGQSLDAIADLFDVDRRVIATWITAHDERLNNLAAQHQPSLFD